MADYEIVGAMVAPHGKAAFDAAPVVARRRGEPGTYLQVRAYVEPDGVKGNTLDEDDWKGLLRSGQAIAVPPAVLVSGVVFWVLRPVFESRDGAISELRMRGALRHDVERLPDGSFGCLVCQPEVVGLRDQWAEAATVEALSWARTGRWEHARTTASRAFVLESAMSPARVAMLSLAHERCGNAVGAQGYVQMAQNSFGDAFAQRVLDWRADLERQLEE